MRESREQRLARIAKALDEHHSPDEAVVHILRNRTPAQKLEMCFAADRGFRGLLEIAIRREHENWPEVEVQREIARRIMTLPKDFEMR